MQILLPLPILEKHKTGVKENLSIIQHEINYANSLRPSVAHYFLNSLEEFIETNQLNGYVEMPNLYRFKNLQELQEKINGLGVLVTTPVGDYLKTTDNMLVLINISSNDLIGLYINFEIVYKNHKDAWKLEKKIRKTFKDYECHDVITRVSWYYQSGRGLDHINFYDVNDVEVHDEAYPYLGTTIKKYVEGFVESKSSVLMLLGPPGTGKTRFIKYIMKHMAKEYKKIRSVDRDIDDQYNDTMNDNAFPVMYSTSQEAYDDDYFFIDFIRGNSRLLILEDIDFNLKSREDGNVFMHKLLSTSDGIIDIKNKKIIITTNLQSRQKTDKALLRPGRMHDILHTKALNREQAETLADKIGVNLTIVNKKDQYTLAEIYNNRLDEETKTSL